MPLDASSGPDYRFLRFGSIWSLERRRIFLERVDRILSADSKGLPEKDTLDPEAEKIVSLIADRPYADICSASDDLRRLFLSDILQALSGAYRDAGSIDPSAQLFERLQSLDPDDEGFLLSVLHDAESVCTEGSRLKYYTEALERVDDKHSKKKLDRASLLSRAREEVEAVLESYRTEFMSRFIDDRFDEYLSSLDGKYDAIKRVRAFLKPLGKFFGRLWDLSEGQWEISAWDSLASYADRLDSCRGLNELLESLGRLEDAEKEARLEAISTLSAKPDWRPSGIGKSEVSGIRFSADLSAMLPSEAALLAFPETELLFLKRLAESSLLTLEYKGEDRFDAPEPRTVMEQRTVDKRGPFILCVDTSGSMHGTPEVIAKTIALAVTRKAIDEDRPCILVSFSTGIKTLELTAVISGLNELLAFLSMSFHGGTDAGPALGFAVEKMAEESWKRADLLMISDLVFPRPEQGLCDRIGAARAAGCRINALTIGPNAHAGSEDLFDHHWSYDSSQGIRKELVQDLDHVRVL